MRPKLKKIKKEIEAEKEATYGEESISGTSPNPESDDDIEKALGEVIGNQPKKPFSLSEEVEKDERG